MLSIRDALASLVAVALWTAIPQTLSADMMPCGPGSHWVDTCPGGTVRLTTTTNAKLSLDLDRNGSLESVFDLVTLHGYTDVYLSPGSSTTHSFSTEIYDLLETITTPFGTITLRSGDGTANGVYDGPLYSSGQVVEESGNSSLADHTVQVMFEVDIPQGAFGTLPNPAMVLHNNTPLVATCIGLTQAPPTGCEYFSSGTLNLYDSVNVLRGQMETAIGGDGAPIAHHVVTPEPGAWLLLTTCVCGLLSKLRQRT